jgi:hypothetical protein
VTRQQGRRAGVARDIQHSLKNHEGKGVEIVGESEASERL